MMRFEMPFIVNDAFEWTTYELNTGEVDRYGLTRDEQDRIWNAILTLAAVGIPADYDTLAQFCASEKSRVMLAKIAELDIFIPPDLGGFLGRSVGLALLLLALVLVGRVLG